MEFNKQLNEILYLIENNYLDNKINSEDLEHIQSLSNFLVDKKDKKSNFEINKDLLNSINFSPLSKPKVYWDKFNRSFYNTRLCKIFIVNSNLFKDSIEYQKEIVLRFIEIEGSFELAYIVNNKVYWIKEGNLLEEINTQIQTGTKTNYDIYRDNFDNDLGRTLDYNFSILTGVENVGDTRKVTIPYNVFSNYTISDGNYIVFLPGIIEDCNNNNNRLTLMMHFCKKIDGRVYPDTVFQTTHYDTFQLCPPYPDGQTRC